MLLGREHISKGFKFSKIVRGLLKKGRRGGGGSDRFTDLDFFFGGGGGGGVLAKRGEVNISGWGWYPWGTLWWIFGKSFMKMLKKNIHFTTTISIYTGHRHFKVLWSFTLYILQRFFLSLRNSSYEFILLYMHKTLPTLENEKQQ